MNRIDETFERLSLDGRKALVIYATAGDPDASISSHVFDAIAGAGADVLEIGVPFSDPTADGPAIQAASARALAAGMSVRGALDLARSVRAKTEAAIILFGYANPFLAFGPRKFARAAGAAGVDGVLIVDLPPEEDDELGVELSTVGLHSIRLLTPTSDDARMKRAAGSGGGFLYYVSVTGVTGGATGKTTTLERAVRRVRSHSTLPVVVGFGISTPQQAAATAKVADGVVVGSAVVRLVEQHGRRAAGPVGEYVASLRRAIDAR